MTGEGATPVVKMSIDHKSLVTLRTAVLTSVL